VARLRDSSLRELDDTPPGLLFGTAGIAWTLGDLGAHDAANELLAAAFRHPLATRSATLGGGAAGIALALMASYCRPANGTTWTGPPGCSPTCRAATRWPR